MKKIIKFSIYLPNFSKTMLHSKISVNFKTVEPFPELVYDTNLATDPTKTEDLIRFCVTFSATNYIEGCYEKYQSMINSAIVSNNIDGLAILWKGVYYCGSNPDFENDVYLAAEFGNLKMFEHTLYGYIHYATLEDLEELEYIKLKGLAKTNIVNPDVLNYISGKDTQYFKIKYTTDFESIKPINKLDL